MADNEYRVQSVHDYLKWVSTESQVSTVETDGGRIDFIHRQMYYRGQSCSKWPIIASVFRGFFRNDLSEYIILRNAYLRLYNVLSECKTNLDKLILLQHYGLRTRLIDVTFNPLIALFFACSDSDKSNSKADGVVFCGNNKTLQNRQIAEFTAEYIFNQNLQNIDVLLRAFAGKKNVSVESFRSPIFIMPPVNNQRLELQNGAFVLSPLIKITGNSIVACQDPLEDTCFFNEKKAIIPGEVKDKILRELNMLGISMSSVFHGITARINDILQEEIWRLEDINNIILE